MSTNTANLLKFDSIAALVDYADRQGSKHQYANKHSHGRVLNGWGEVKKAVSEPWEHGLDVVFGMIHEINRELDHMAPPKDARRRARWSEDCGDDICVDRMRSGQAFWREMAKREVNAPRQVTLFVNVSCTANVGPDDVLWRGAAAICIADLLEKVGYRVEMQMVRYTHDGTTVAKAKDMTEPVDVSALVNSVSAWFYRTVCFTAVSPNQPWTIKPDTDFVVDIAGSSLTFVVDGVFDRGAALDLIKNIVKGLNGDEG